MSYLPIEIIKALNDTGLWHGRASIKIAPQVRKAFQENPYKKWEHELWEAFGGLYVTQSRNTAFRFAKMAADAIEKHYWSDAVDYDWAVPIIHQIILLPEVEIALDEDSFGWSYIPQFPDRKWEVLGVYGSLLELAIKAGIEDEIQEEVYQHRLHLREKAKSDPSFKWNPIESKSMVNAWTKKWTPILLYTWYAMWIKFINGEIPPGPDLWLPELRIINQEWEAIPPITNRL